MVDLHTHILPSVDDGAKSIDEALKMVKLALQNGTHNIVVTPHYMTLDDRSSGLSKNELCSRFESFKNTVAKHYPEVNLFFGAEVFCSHNIERLIDNNSLITLNNTKYVLIEVDFDETLNNMLQAVKALTTNGYIPILAHPERYSAMSIEPWCIEPFLELGVRFQINASSLLGKHGKYCQNLAMDFIGNRITSAVSSDCHDLLFRTPDLSEAHMLVSSHFSPAFAEELFYNNPLAIINGQEYLNF